MMGCCEQDSNLEAKKKMREKEEGREMMLDHKTCRTTAQSGRCLTRPLAIAVTFRRRGEQQKHSFLGCHAHSFSQYVLNTYQCPPRTQQ